MNDRFDTGSVLSNVREVQDDGPVDKPIDPDDNLSPSCQELK